MITHFPLLVYLVRSRIAADNDCNRMAWISPEVHDVLSRIDDLNLPHPSGPLLSSFILGAVDPHLAAQYLSPRLSPVEAREAVSVCAYIVNSSMTFTGIWFLRTRGANTPSYRGRPYATTTRCVLVLCSCGRWLKMWHDVFLWYGGKLQVCA